MIIDSHIHVGQFRHLYTSPKEMACFLQQVDVKKALVSSTTICEGNYLKVLTELKTVIKISGEENVLPVLWITRQMFFDDIVPLFLNSDLHWRCLKIHPDLDPGIWTVGSKCMNYVLNLAKQMHLPLLIHTGETEYSRASVFTSLICSNPEVTFILAHGRPIDEILLLLEKYGNVYVDTAFMPIDDIVRLCFSGYVARILWGTDMPIPRYFYPTIDMRDYYKGKLSRLHSKLNGNMMDYIIQLNFMKLFDL